MLEEYCNQINLLNNDCEIASEYVTAKSLGRVESYESRVEQKFQKFTVYWCLVYL